MKILSNSQNYLYNVGVFQKYGVLMAIKKNNLFKDFNE